MEAKGVNPRHLSYQSKSDMLKGYLIVPECCDAVENGLCVGCGEVCEFGKDNETGDVVAWLYLYLNSDKEETDKFVKVRLADIYATMFGKGFNTAYIGTEKENAVFKKGTESTVSFIAKFDDAIFPKRPFIKSEKAGNGLAELDYNMLGFTSLDGVINFSGFGRITPYVRSTTSLSFCLPPETNTVKCARISSVSGSLTGEFNYGNLGLCESCEEYGLTDPCAYYNNNTAAAVSGTWNIKYNTKISKMKFYTPEDFEAFIVLPKNSKRPVIVEGDKVEE